MATGKYQRNEFATRAHAVYDSELRHKVEPNENGRFLALEVETGDYEIADSIVAANQKMRERHPLPTLFFTFKVGYPTAVKMVGARYRNRP